MLLHKDFIEINPYIEIATQNIRITKDNAAHVFSGYEYICEAFDQAEEKAMLINTLLSECPDGGNRVGKRNGRTFQTLIS